MFALAVQAPALSVLAVVEVRWSDSKPVSDRSYLYQGQIRYISRPWIWCIDAQLTL